MMNLYISLDQSLVLSCFVRSMFTLPILLVRSQSQPHKVFVLKSSCSIHSSVSGSEAVSESLDLNTHHYEVVQSQSLLTRTVLGQQVGHKLWTEPETIIDKLK